MGGRQKEADLRRISRKNFLIIRAVLKWNELAPEVEYSSFWSLQAETG